MSREAPCLPSDRPPRLPGWWVKMGIGGLLLTVLVAVTGLEVRREQLRSVLRDAANARLVPRVASRPVFFQEATPGEALACLSGIEYWRPPLVADVADAADAANTADAADTAETADTADTANTEAGDAPASVAQLLECASRSELGQRRYVSLGNTLPSSVFEFGARQEPRECVRVAFALLRASHDVIHARREEGYQARDTQLLLGVHQGVALAVRCGLAEPQLQAEVRSALAELELDIPLLDGSVVFVQEEARREAYRWMARTAWDYDDPFFFDAGGLWARYRRQFSAWSDWKKTNGLTELCGVNVATAGARLRELRASAETSVFDLDLEHVATLRSGRMLLGEPPLADPSTGMLLHLPTPR